MAKAQLLKEALLALMSKFSPESKAARVISQQELRRGRGTLQSTNTPTQTVEEVMQGLEGTIPAGGATKPIGQSTIINEITGEVEPINRGPDTLTSSGGAPFDPLEDAVRSKTVIEGTTKPERIKGNFTGKHVITNPGIEPRLTRLLKRQAAGDKELAGLSKNDLETLALEERNAKALANQKAKAPRPARVIKGTGGSIRTNPDGSKSLTGGQRLDQHGNSIKKSQGNPETQLDGPREVFGEKNVEQTAGMVKGDENLGDEVIRELDAAQRQRNKIDRTKNNPNKTRTGSQNIHNASQLDNLGISKDEQRLLDEVNRIRSGVQIASDKAPPKAINRRIGQSIKGFGESEKINSTIQDLFTRLDRMFPGFKKDTPDSDAFFEFTQPKFPMNAKRIERGLNQGSAASQLNDTRKQLSKLAEDARDPATSPAKLAKIKEEIAKIDNEFFGTNKSFDDLAADGPINPESNVEAVSQFGSDNVNDASKSFLDFKSKARTDEGAAAAFGRTNAEADLQIQREHRPKVIGGRPPALDINILKLLQPGAAQGDMPQVLLNVLRELLLDNKASPRLGAAESRVANQPVPLTLREQMVRNGPRNAQELIGR